MSTDADIEKLWLSQWPLALASWSAYTQMREPLFFETEKEAAPYGMAGTIAAIRLQDQTIMVNLPHIKMLHLEDSGLEILAHEIGHHVYVPANLTDNARMNAAMKPVFMGLSADTAPFVANLYGDLMINDRLQRLSSLDMAGVYRKMKENSETDGASDVWKVYTRAYEYLWLLEPGSISPADVTRGMKSDAALIAALIRSYAGEWLHGVRRFAHILYPYLAADDKKKQLQTFRKLGLDDTRNAGAAGAGRADNEAIPDGLAGIDESETGNDDDFGDPLAGMDGDFEPEADGPGADAKGRKQQNVPKAPNTAPEKEGSGNKGQYREPFQYGELLRSLGLKLSDHEITTRYYRERALPHLIPFPMKKSPSTTEPLAEGYESWDVGDSIEDLDVFGSVMRSPFVIPGVTTLKRVYGESPGSDPAKRPVDLDIYIDCSGSMPDPARNVSYLALAGTILAMSALRAGACVQATLWSGAGQFESSRGFVRNEAEILGIVTGYISGGTAFPLNVLRDTYASRKPADPTVHIVVISDNGVDTILADDEKKQPGRKICEKALEAARGGGTLVLNLPGGGIKWPPGDTLTEIGFKIHRVTDWEKLVEFARAFVRENYEQRA